MKGKIAVTGWKDWMNVKVLQKVVIVDEIDNILLQILIFDYLLSG